MFEELKKLIEDMNKAFAAYKEESAAKIAALEARGSNDVLIDEKLKRISDDLANMSKIGAQMEAIEKTVAKMEAQGHLGGGGGQDPNRVYQSLGQQLIDVYNAANPDVASNLRAESIARLKKVRAAATGAGEGVPSDGGFLVQQDFASMLDQGVMATGLLPSRCFQIPISGNANGIKANLLDETSRANGSRFGGIQTYWAAEAATVTATKPKFRQATWDLHKLFALFYATEELLQDAAAMAAMVNHWFPMEFGFKMDDAIINGVGAGIPLGILNSGCLVAVAKETNQAADTIVVQNVLKMYSRILDSARPNAVWMINADCFPQLYTMSLSVGTGGAPVMLPPGGASTEPYMTLLGRPIIPIEQCATIGDQGDIIFADFREYALADKGGIQSAVSMHVMFIYDEMTFRWTYRADGQPFRNSAITPYKGSATRSPFITLAAR
ncbi:MAG: phage major capsid protein [bacterium]